MARETWLHGRWHWGSLLLATIPLVHCSGNEDAQRADAEPTESGPALPSRAEETSTGSPQMSESGSPGNAHVERIDASVVEASLLEAGLLETSVDVSTADADRPIEAGALEGGRTASDASIDKPGWQLLWHDEFDGASLDSSKWEPYIATYGKDFAFDGDVFAYMKHDVSVEAGLLHIAARKEHVVASGKTREYSSGAISSSGKFAPKYGYLETRVKLTSARGLIPAFWLMPTCSMMANGGTGSEIDVFEHPSSWQRYRFNTICGTPSCTQSYEIAHPFSDDAPWHTFALQWDATQIVSVLDGQVEKTYTGKGVPQCPEYLLLSISVGGWGGTIDDAKLPDEFQVDYVRVYQKE